MPPQQSVRTGSFSTAYYHGGRGAGTPVILVHGGGAGAESVSNWQRSFPLFAAHGPTYAMDMVGFGNSDAPVARGVRLHPGRTQPAADRLHRGARPRSGAPHRQLDGRCDVAGRGHDATRTWSRASSSWAAGGGLSTLIADLGPVIHYDFTVEGMRAIIGVLANPGFIPSDEQVQYRYEMSIRPAPRPRPTRRPWAGCARTACTTPTTRSRP